MSAPLSVDDLIARFPGTNRQSWAQLRYRGTGPAYFKVGRRVFYRPADLLAWEAAGVRTRTDEHPAGVAR